MKNLFNPISICFSTRYQSGLLNNRLSLKNNEVHIWLLEIEKIKSSLSDISLILSFNEIEKAKKFRTFTLQRLFCLSHGYLRLILSSYLLCLPQRIEFKYGQYGKPYLKDNFQANNQTIYFNMSHSHNAVLYGIYLNSEIGVDLEYIQQDLDWQEIANLVLTQKEKKKILLLPKKSAQIKEFYRIWTCKEAFLKARGTGLNISPSSIETNYLPNYCFHHSGFRKYMINFLNLNSSIHSFEILPNYMSAFVVSEEAKALKFFNTIY